jgi:serine/threonine protein kinase
MKNIKNFIRQGKQAHEQHGEEHHEQNGQQEQQQQHRHPYDYNELASELVREEQKLQSSQYPGLENYKVVEKLGEGAFSTVHKAIRLETQELVAIKIIKKFQMDDNQRTSVLKEATIMRQLNHENIVKFIEFKEVPEFYYIVQEIVEGGEIFNEIVKYTYFSEDLSRHVLKQVAEAIKYLHEEVGIVHRDIKPENLLFQPIPIVPSRHIKLRRSDDPNKLDEGEFINGVGGGGVGIVKLADFGLSKQIWYDNTKTPCGTVGYTAPEIVRDQHYSKGVDMWALGCVLYTLLCGFPPFYDERVDVLTEKVARGEYHFLRPWWDEISDGAKNCVRNLLTVDPDRRYTIDQLLQDPWLTEVPFVKPKRVLHQFKRSEPMYSPAARVMKDAFDISNAVHRQEEESKRQQQPDILEEEDEILEEAKPTTGDLETNSGRFVKQIKLEKTCPLESKTFELNLNSSTIINRRKNKVLS